MASNAGKTPKSALKSKEEQKMKGSFAEILYDLIKDNKTTSDIVSKKTGIAKGTMSNYLNAKTSPKALELKKLADHFNVTTDYLLGRTEIKTVDIDVRAIHEKTGLSEQAIERLCLLNINTAGSMGYLNLIIENKKLADLLRNIENLEYAIILEIITGDIVSNEGFGDKGLGITLNYAEYVVFLENMIKDQFANLIKDPIKENISEEAIEKHKEIHEYLKECNLLSHKFISEHQTEYSEWFDKNYSGT